MAEAASSSSRSATDGQELAAANERAAKAEALLELFLEHAPDVVTVLEPNGTQRSAHGSVRRLLGYSEGEAVEDNLAFVHPEDRPEVERRLRLLMETDITWLPPTRFRVRAADGSWRWFETSMSDLRDTELSGFLTFGRDVTEHEEAIRANEEARARVEALVASFRDPLVLVGADGVVGIANDAYLSLFGLERDEVLGRKGEDLWPGLSRLFQEPASFRDRTLGILGSGEAVRGEEVRLADGRVFQLDFLPVRSDGRELGRMWTLHDVTQERDALDQRQRLLELERRAREAAQTQIEELAELDGLRRRLVSTVSHELRTPLTAILSYLQLVLDDPAGRLDAEDAAALETAHRNAQRLRRLVDDLLEVQRLDQGKAVLLLGEVDVAALVREEVATIEPTAAEHGIELRAEVDPVPALEADDGRLRQVVDNILDNAIHYTAAGGRVTARVAREDDSVRIEIEDTGIGIAPADVPHVFEPFFRAPGADGHRPTGSGLGLAIARGIVEAHGGTIECASVPGRGTTFSLRLPSHPSRSTP